MVSKISDRKSHSDYALSILSDWPEGTEGLFTIYMENPSGLN
jgi:hypothetical protein